MEHKIYVPDMRCSHCEERISAALTQLKMDFTVCLQEKTVVVRGDSAQAQTAFDEIYDLGFTPEKT